MSWSKSIILAFVFFVAFILYMVVGSFNENIDLVAEDYYQQEIEYQNVIDKSANYKKLGKRLIIKESEGQIQVKLPHDEQATITGKVYFFRPSDKVNDVTYTIDKNTTTFSKDELIKGLYLIKVSWEKDGVDYYYEQNHFVQK